MADFGADVLVFPDLPDSFETNSTSAVLLDAVLRRLSTRRGLLAFHGDWGIDVAEYINESISEARLFQIKADVESELARDERIFSASADVSFDANTQRLRLEIELIADGGPFRMVIGVSSVSIELLSEG